MANWRILKYGFTFLALLMLIALAILYRAPSGMGVTVLESEKTFNTQLHNSLYYIDMAKQEWVGARNKPDASIPLLEDLRVHLGKWTNEIRRLESLGVKYQLTSLEKSQTDVATLTRDLYFRAGPSRFYPAETSFGIKSRWKRPSRYDVPAIVVIREFIIEKRLGLPLLMGAVIFCMLAVVLHRRRLPH